MFSQTNEQLCKNIDVGVNLNLFHTDILERFLCPPTLQWGGLGLGLGGLRGDFQGPTYKSKLPDPGRSCQQSLVFNLQKKKRR